MHPISTDSLDSLECQYRRLERQNQALKQSLSFALDALRNLFEIIQPESPTIALLIAHQNALDTLVNPQKTADGRNHSGNQKQGR
ncbi:MAG: hypothetical protein F6J97_00425 [Leptolyngbya sp. SIO4C1]|nr:hypothetical protein [Leptolyngbya sp. SIO4C1]